MSFRPSGKFAGSRDSKTFTSGLAGGLGFQLYRELMPRLANDYRLIAPDLPGFGFTEVPAERQYVYTFDRLAATLDAFTQALDLRRYASSSSIPGISPWRRTLPRLPPQ